MSVETKTNLNKATVSKLQDLIRINIDSEEGFQEAATHIEDVSLRGVFTELAAQRSQNATELQEYVQWNGEKPRDEGSYAAAFHRTWMDLRAKLSGGDEHVILSEAERGEDSIKQAYQDALKETAGSAVNDVLTRQFANVKAGHDRIRDLRDHYAQ
ncbi:MAG TPA: PA2169 family four-helix-bundle protein [Nitrospira sp.]|nr:PA2169 family four-helix-bundle protein [Nitrospira sp.]